MLTLLALVGSTAACPAGPSATAVVERLSLLRSPAAPAIPWVIAFSPEGSGLRLEASSAGLSVRRDLPGDATCASLEQAAAVVLFLKEQSLDSPPRVPVTPREVSASAAPEPEPAWRWSGGIGQGFDVAPTQPTWLALAEVALRRDAARAGARLSVRLLGPRAAAVGGVLVDWTRVDLALGPDLRFAPGAVVVSAVPQLVLGRLWLGVHGPGVAATIPAEDLGARLGLRLAPASTGGSTPWLEVAAVAWFLRHRVILQGSGWSEALPPVDVDVVLGVAWGG